MSSVSTTHLKLNEIPTEYSHMNSTEEEKDNNVFIFVMMFGTIFAVQVFVLIVFGTMRVCDTVFSFRNQATTIDQPEPPTEYQFPFLPSYLMAVSETRMNEQTTETLTEDTYLLYDSIV